MRGFEPPISCVTGRRFKPLSYTVKVGGAGFEPAKAEPSDLQSDSFNHSEILPNSLCLKTELRRSMGHLGFEPRTNRLKAGYSTAELMSQKVKFSRFESWSLLTTWLEYHQQTSGNGLVATQATVTDNKKGEETFGFSPLSFAFMDYILHMSFHVSKQGSTLDMPIAAIKNVNLFVVHLERHCFRPKCFYL